MTIAMMKTIMKVATLMEVTVVAIMLTHLTVHNVGVWILDIQQQPCKLLRFLDVVLQIG